MLRKVNGGNPMWPHCPSRPSSTFASAWRAAPSCLTSPSGISQSSFTGAVDLVILHSASWLIFVSHLSLPDSSKHYGFCHQGGGRPERAFDNRGGAEGESVECAALPAQARPPSQQHLQVWPQAVDVPEVDPGEAIVKDIEHCRRETEGPQWFSENFPTLFHWETSPRGAQRNLLKQSQE